MPNWTTNVLRITGDKNQLCKFREDSKNESEKTELDFNAAVPMPVELNVDVVGNPSPELQEKYDRNLKRYGAKSWYDWCRQNWGTKWNANDVVIEDESENKLEYRFETAWTAPVPWLEEASKKYPGLEFEMWSSYEGGEGATKTCAENGGVSETEVSYHEFNVECDEEYRRYFENILHGDYDELIESCIEEEMLPHSDLEPYLAKRIRDEDLPRFVNFQWCTNVYTKRLKGEPICTTE